MTTSQITNGNEHLATLLRDEGWRVWNVEARDFEDGGHDQYDVMLCGERIICRDPGVQSAVCQLLKEHGARIS
jgi:hypothetical protein